ncbi:uvrD/REP helicase N-terminal domain protein [Neisseria gonorrhoeae]|nr:uvrD/REP helicase N-terminal domain protein [Neisseria gonorrhoeae]
MVVTFTKAATARAENTPAARVWTIVAVLESKELPNLETNTLSDGIGRLLRRTPRRRHLPARTLEQALQKESRTRLIVRLKAAIGQFDNAAIYTIHGFCQRIRRDYAFCAKHRVDVELTEEDGDRLLSRLKIFGGNASAATRCLPHWRLNAKLAANRPCPNPRLPVPPVPEFPPSAGGFETGAARRRKPHGKPSAACCPSWKPAFGASIPTSTATVTAKNSFGTFLRTGTKIRRRTTALSGQRHARTALETLIRQTRSRTEKRQNARCGSICRIAETGRLRARFERTRRERKKQQ